MSVVRNKVVLVTGGAGFIGSALVRELVDNGAMVISYDNYLHGSNKNFQNMDVFTTTKQLIIIHGDVLDKNLLKETIRNFDAEYIINCIGDPFIPATDKYPERCYQINVDGTFCVLSAAEECNIKRIVHISTCEVYGVNDIPKLSESNAINPCSKYAEYKYFAEKCCERVFNKSNCETSVVIARLFNCYGPRATHPYIIPEIIKQLDESNVLYLGNLTQRDFTYIYDTVKAIIAILAVDFGTSRHSQNRNIDIVNVGSGIAYSIDYLVRRLADIMGVSNVKIVKDENRSRLRLHDIPRFVCDSSKLRQTTNWKPQIGIDEGLYKTVTWFKENGNQWNFSQND
jgi:nucleoside-diphosphate-sugar epimerase